MTELMEDILSISCAEANKISIRPVSIDLESFCHELIHELSLGIGVGYHYNLEFSSLPEINLDAKLLRHILSNLLGNAAKYSPRESFIDLKVDYIDDKIIFKVKDSCIGISSEDQLHIFESFHRGKNVDHIPGTGLGLHIVKRYVDLLNGTIEVQSQLGNGSTFLVSLPQGKDISKN
jgi:signal transduction histidine kinase